jgi:hypothetical protein
MQVAEKAKPIGLIVSLRNKATAAADLARLIPFDRNASSPESKQRHRLLMRSYALEFRLSPGASRAKRFLSQATLHRNFSR